MCIFLKSKKTIANVDHDDAPNLSHYFAVFISLAFASSQRETTVLLFQRVISFHGNIRVSVSRLVIRCTFNGTLNPFIFKLLCLYGLGGGWVFLLHVDVACEERYKLFLLPDITRARCKKLYAFIHAILIHSAENKQYPIIFW